MKHIIINLIFLLSLYSVENDYYQDLSKSTDLFFDVYSQINSKYVDQIVPTELIDIGIKSMLESLDPYTVILQGNEKSHYDDLTNGKYGGIGIYIGVSGKDKRLTVISPIDDTPASKVGLRAGDQIFYIDDLSTDGMTTSDASNYLRGDEGSRVILKIKRASEDKLLDFEIIRETIKINNVPYSALLENNIAYIKVSQFSQGTPDDVRTELKKYIDQNASGVILDLRFNPGGLLKAAVDMCNIFVPKGLEIVSTRGKNDVVLSSYKTNSEPLDTEIPLVVLINESSASASEIVSGAMQDYDRGIIIGQNSFGKGLVQQIYSLTDTSAIKITIAKYYTPSGRLIQKKDYFSGSDEKVSAIEDFETVKNRRLVHSGNGIEPDVFVEAKTFSEFVAYLRMKNVFTDFVYDFYKDNNDFNYTGIDDGVFSEFKSYSLKFNSEFKTKSEIVLDSMVISLKDENLLKDYSKEIETLREKFTDHKTSLFDINSDDIKNLLETEFSVYNYGNSSKYTISLRDDPQVKKAVEILNDLNNFKTLLGYEEK
ncbi:MAG: S41 family peptidase [Candidatus Delongbacteria bacterium]|nr:S41 family peptidase [Candidatus Delongbacteria bacterium]MBN2837004.1 S41 family peptidase [Candidatus Delongbacteria bacterium]